MVSPVTQFFRVLRKKDFYSWTENLGETVRIGGKSGGWEMLLNGLNAQSVVYSFGLGENVSFDLALISRFGLTVHGFDPTPRSLAWLRSHVSNPSLVIHDYGIAARDGEIAFFPPKRAGSESYSAVAQRENEMPELVVPVRRLTTISRDLGHDHINVLKMDVEGVEYEVIDDLLASELRPDHILIEFHHRFPGIGVEKTKAAIRALNRAGYVWYWASRSNRECSFIHERALKQA